MNADTNTSGQADAPRYWAFISYSHRDSKVASVVQRALETYRIPKRLIDTVTKFGKVPAALKPIFRDRDEMEAGADLKATVREALLQSRYLIVICSPDAARSPWVNQEIIEFKKLAGESRVLALIAAGEPFASGTPGHEAEECFPQALRFALTPEGKPEGEALEPIAADLRPQGDGKRLAILKLIAGIVGVGVDELVRRDALRRARRLAYVASGAVAGMAVMAVLTVMAVQSRTEALNQRAQAEDLIEFMLGDLRKKLDLVGRLDVLDSVGEKALSYYAKQDADRLDANALGRRARAMHLIGEMSEQRGNLDEALAAFKKASDTTAELLARAPNDGQRVFDHAQSVYWVGYMAWRRGNTQEAEEAFRNYMTLARKLVNLDKTKPDWQLETAYAAQNLGVVQLESGNPAEALKSFNEGRRVKEELVGVKPELTLDLAKSYGWSARAQEELGNYQEAANTQQEKIVLLNSLRDFASNKPAQYLLANGYYEIGRLELELGNMNMAEDVGRKATTLITSLVASDPANTFWLTESCLMRLGLAEIELAAGKRQLARNDLNQVRPHVLDLLKRDKSETKWQIKLRGRELELEGQAALRGEYSDSTSDIENFLENVKLLESRGKRISTDQSLIIASVEFTLGELLSRAGHRPEAIDRWRETEERVRPLASRENLPAIAILARVLQRLGRQSEVEALVAKLKNSTYRHPAFADLVT